MGAQDQAALLQKALAAHLGPVQLAHHLLDQ